MSKVYIASPLFTERQRATVNSVVRHWLDIHPYDEVYKPQDFKVPNAWDMPNSDWADAVEKEDRIHLDAADVVIGVLYGMNSDDGTAWEIGYASAKGKKIVLFMMNEGGTYSLMMKNVAAEKYIYCSTMVENQSVPVYRPVEDAQVYWA